MADDFTYDVFLSHSSHDKPVVRALAERLRQDGLRVWFDDWILKPGDHFPSKIEEGLEHSRVLLLFMSAHAFGSDWAQLEYQTFRFRDPLNKQRRFLPLHLDDTEPKGSLAQFNYINWPSKGRKKEYAKLLEACRPQVEPPRAEAHTPREQNVGNAVLFKLNTINNTVAFAFSPDELFILTGGHDGIVRAWDVETGRCLRVFEGHTYSVRSLALSADRRFALSGNNDNTVQLWDVETGRRLRVLKGHRNSVEAVVWSSDRCHALSGSLDKTVRVWTRRRWRCWCSTGRRMTCSRRWGSGTETSCALRARSLRSC